MGWGWGLGWVCVRAGCVWVRVCSHGLYAGSSIRACVKEGGGTGVLGQGQEERTRGPAGRRKESSCSQAQRLSALPETID